MTGDELILKKAGVLIFEGAEGGTKAERANVQIIELCKQERF
jgi:hypothetical protein